VTGGRRAGPDGHIDDGSVHEPPHVYLGDDALTSAQARELAAALARQPTRLIGRRHDDRARLGLIYGPSPLSQVAGRVLPVERPTSRLGGRVCMAGDAGNTASALGHR
jgi:hypothetical protein